MNQRTRELMTMQKALHPRKDIDRLYMSRTEEEGRTLTSIEDCVDTSIQELEEYNEQRKTTVAISSNGNIRTEK